MELIEFERVISSSGKTRLYRLPTGNGTVKCVAHIAADGRLTVSVSTMIGCPLSCSFCAMGSLPAKPLSTAEIIGQVQRIVDDCNGLSLYAIRFDVSGDPLFNWRAVAGAVRTLNERYQPSFLLCTAAPATRYYSEVIQLGQELKSLELQISVHASSDTARAARFQQRGLLSLREIDELATRWLEVTGRLCSFNYALDGRNATHSDALRLSELLPAHRWRVQITPTYVGNPPVALGSDHLSSFQEELEALGYQVEVYFPKDALEIEAVPGTI